MAYLPGLAMRRIADLYPGRAKTDARDAFVIADAARCLPHTLRPVDVGDEALAELEVLVGFYDDLADEATRISNRIRGLLTGIHPALEHAIGPQISHPAVLEALSRCGGPASIAKAGRHKLAAIAKVHAPRLGDKLVEAIMTALGEQTVTVPGTAAADTVLPRLADSLKTILQQRKQGAEQVERILDAHPLAGVLTSMPGIGVKTAAHICSKSATPPISPPRGIWRPTPASPRSPSAPAPASRANISPRAQPPAHTDVRPRRLRRPVRLTPGRALANTTPYRRGAGGVLHGA
ncbi:transposase [Actinokineospora auranticolor]|uniref:Transposase n=1 Tax=Actinokineospora auranticolor TaxID=155976 RepID=A0A2S6GLD3_9PSEU|nr:transposase [Actinokineospora auranticolor]